MFNKLNSPVGRSPTTSAPRSGIPNDAQTANPAPPSGPGPQTASATGGTAKPAPVPAESGSRLIVGPEVKLKSAEILDCDTLVVEGRVEATMDSRVIRIAEHGVYAGKVCIDIAEIHGQFEGELTVRGQLLIHATGRVSGKVRYGKMLIEEGGQISGEIHAIDESTARPQPSRPSATPPPAVMTAAA